MPPEGYEARAAGVITNPDALICSKVQDELQDKSAKQYLVLMRLGCASK
jgi:hypothetical protein